MRISLSIATALLLAPSPASSQQSVPRLTYVIVHGAWGGSWDWKRVDSMLTARGQVVYRVALTGLGERVHLASPAIGLDVHISDVVNTILWEELRDVVLVGHSYGGMVITGVADRIPDRIRRLVYLDAFLPESGESVADMRATATAGLLDSNTRDGMVVPPWVAAGQPLPRDVPHPLRTFTDTLLLKNPDRARVPATYILTVEPNEPVDNFQKFADRARARGWDVKQLAADHVPERSAPGALVDMLVAPGSPQATDGSRSGMLFDELARMDSILFEAAFVTCNNERIDSILADNIEFVHDQTGFQSGQEVRETFDRLTANCPRQAGVTRELVAGSLAVYPIKDYGAVQMGDHRFIERGAASGTRAKFIHLWRRTAEGKWELARVLSIDHHPEQ